MDVSVIGIDLGKNTCSVAGMDAAGSVVFRRRVSRAGLVEMCVGTKAASSRWRPAAARIISAGSSPQEDTGAADVAGVCAALRQGAEERRPRCGGDRRGGDAADDALRDAEERGAARTCRRCIGRATRLVGERTALINQLRAVLLERGIVIPPRGGAKLRASWRTMLAGATCRLSPRMRRLWSRTCGREWRELDRGSRPSTTSSPHVARSRRGARRLATIPGIGVINATALVAAVGDARAFARGRDLAAWLGLVPRQVTTGGKPRLLGISKRGNKYLRKPADPRRTGRHCPRSPSQRHAARHAGCAVCSHGRTRMPSWWRSRTSWRGSPGRCCAAAAASTRRPSQRS